MGLRNENERERHPREQGQPFRSLALVPWSSGRTFLDGGRLCTLLSPKGYVVILHFTHSRGCRPQGKVGLWAWSLARAFALLFVLLVCVSWVFLLPFFVELGAGFCHLSFFPLFVSFAVFFLIACLRLRLFTFPFPFAPPSA